jgi:hypothetical protein
MSLARQLRRIGSRSLGEFPFDVVRIECERCSRAGRYALARLIERFGADAAGPDVLMELAACERRKNFSQPCGARFPDLAALPPCS